VGSVLCFFGVRKCTAPSQEENIDHKPQFHLSPWDSKYERTKRTVHHIQKERNGTGTIYPMDSHGASQVNIHHRRAGLRSGTLNITTPSVHAMNSGNSARSLTGSMWEEVCAGLTPSEIEGYTPYYRCAPGGTTYRETSGGSSTLHAMNSGNSARSLTSSMWEEVCAGLTPSVIEAYTPYYTGGVTYRESGGSSTLRGTNTIYPEDSSSQV
jgi:hypothetical protein